MLRWLFPTPKAPEPEPKYIDERVLERLLKPEPFAPLQVLKAAHLCSNKLSYHPAIEDALMQTFTNIFVFIPPSYKLTKNEIAQEFDQDKADQSRASAAPIDHRTRTDIKAFGHLVARSARYQFRGTSPAHRHDVRPYRDRIDGCGLGAAIMTGRSSRGRCYNGGTCRATDRETRR